jgi:TetR/AcrR family transcriptional repressor of bet genes
MPRASTEARRAQIVAGLKQVMAVQGYAGANMRAIADAAGLTSGLLHYHFPSKQAILLGLLDSLAERWRSRVDPSLRGRAALRVIIDVTVGMEHAEPEALACWMQIGALAVQQPTVQAAWRRVMTEQLDRLTTHCATEGKGPAEAATLLALLEGYLRLGTSCPGVVPAGSAASMAHRVLEAILT